MRREIGPSAASWPTETIARPSRRTDLIAARSDAETAMPSPTPPVAARLGRTVLDIVIADITTLAVDAIVNAANRSLLGGGGVDGAIHRAAGPELVAACRVLGGCDTGSAKITPGFRLPARYVIHAVGPVWSDGSGGEDALLAGCYRTALALAREHGLVSLAYSAISTGIYGFPPERAAHIAVGTVAEEIEDRPASIERVVFCCFGEASAAHHAAAFRARGLA
jgi:O-acetyl-ADP-ribose deacetylase (regulator of RNase III)